MNKLSLAVICALGLGKNVIVLEKCRLSAATRSEPKAV